MTRTEISNIDDLIDIRDVIERVEELETEVQNIDDMPDGDQMKNTVEGDEAREELKRLTDFLNECNGNGGDEQWRGDWYPVTCIRDTYFQDYAEELVKDIGDLPKEIPHYIAIDWEATAENIRQDYTSVEFDGVTYWVR